MPQAWRSGSCGRAVGSPDLVASGVVGPLGRILEELSRGGGAKGINIDQVCRPQLAGQSALLSEQPCRQLCCWRQAFPSPLAAPGPCWAGAAAQHSAGEPEHSAAQVIVELEEMTRRFPFQVPSYFALILRAFSVIEGIALRADPTYSIVQECFPYLARRLLTDNSPRVRVALRQLLYGVRCTLCLLVSRSR